MKKKHLAPNVVQTQIKNTVDVGLYPNILFSYLLYYYRSSPIIPSWGIYNLIEHDGITNSIMF